MAISTIKKPLIKSISGTLSDETGDYMLANAVPNGYQVMCGRYFTTYNQYRLLQVGQSGTALVIQNANSSMANCPYEVFLYGGGVNARLLRDLLSGAPHEYIKDRKTFNKCFDGNPLVLGQQWRWKILLCRRNVHKRNVHNQSNSYNNNEGQSIESYGTRLLLVGWFREQTLFWFRCNDIFKWTINSRLWQSSMVNVFHANSSGKVDSKLPPTLREEVAA